ncbi:hypothetical protein [Pseudoxanthomonas dokdonensis]|uniref:hypothetical protein n=1 Tax=Pseudoxanthomonas dokdonensis TaxID=344882 RepID=UPI00070EBBD7|nr:hypothetical protein [Pseudoxanthomonas dokdonensis]
MLIIIGRYIDPWEAYILRGLLLAEGIPASVAGDQHVVANWPMSMALGGVALQVPLAFREQAAALIDDYHAGVLEQAFLADDPSRADTCPACGSLQIAAAVPLTQKLLAVATCLVASAPFPARASRMSCRACGNHWH